MGPPASVSMLDHSGPLVSIGPLLNECQSSSLSVVLYLMPMVGVPANEPGIAVKRIFR